MHTSTMTPWKKPCYVFTTAYLVFLVFFGLEGFFFFVAGFNIAAEAAWPSTVGRDIVGKHKGSVVVWFGQW